MSCLCDAESNIEARTSGSNTTASVQGPNSNSFAYRLILQCGGGLGVPLGDVLSSGVSGIGLPWNIEPEF